MEKVEQMESKYGSVTNAPDDCVELQTCHQIAGMMPGDRKLKFKEQLQDVQQMDANHYTIREMADILHMPKSTVAKRLNHIKHFGI